MPPPPTVRRALAGKWRLPPGVPGARSSAAPTGVRSQAGNVFDPVLPALALNPAPTGVRSQLGNVFDPVLPALAPSPGLRYPAREHGSSQDPYIIGAYAPSRAWFQEGDSTLARLA